MLEVWSLSILERKLGESWKECLEEQGVGRTGWRRIKGVGRACEKVREKADVSPAGLIVCVTTGALGRTGVCECLHILGQFTELRVVDLNLSFCDNKTHFQRIPELVLSSFVAAKLKA